MRQIKRRISITELTFKNLIDKQDEHLQKKIMRMDALLRVKYKDCKNLFLERIHFVNLIINYHILSELYLYEDIYNQRADKKRSVLEVAGCCVYSDVWYKKQT